MGPGPDGLVAGVKKRNPICRRCWQTRPRTLATLRRNGRCRYCKNSFGMASASTILREPCGGACTSLAMSGNVRGMCWRRIRSERKKRQICRAISGLPSRSVLLVEDETDLLLFPPLRASWSQRGQPAEVLLSGWNTRRVVFGAMNLVTGHRLFQVRQYQQAEDFQAFLAWVHAQYRGWHVTLLLDSAASHTADASRSLAQRLGVRLLWLPKRAPELNPVDTLWGQAKDNVSANKQYASIDEQVDLFISYLYGLSDMEALQTSGVLSKRFWLNRILSKNFCPPA